MTLIDSVVQLIAEMEFIVQLANGCSTAGMANMVVLQ